MDQNYIEELKSNLHKIELDNEEKFLRKTTIEKIYHKILKEFIVSSKTRSLPFNL